MHGRVQTYRGALNLTTQLFGEDMSPPRASDQPKPADAQPTVNRRLTVPMAAGRRADGPASPGQSGSAPRDRHRQASRPYRSF
jgi:hypothetical protein